MKKHFLYRKTLSLFAVLTLLFSGAFSFQALSADNAIKTVKVGFFKFPGYHKQENGVRGGYGYDFLTLLQTYTNLNYEYIGYENSWEEMQQMLLDGRIDLLTSARKTIEREKLFDFSMPIGINSAQINVRSNDERFIPGNFTALNGITIGFLTGNSRNADVMRFAEEKGFSFTSKEFASVERLQQALQDNTVDAIATSSLRKSSEEKTIAEFTPQRFYAIVRKGDTELLNEINYGIDQLDSNEGNWRDDLYYKNYVAKSDTVLSFTKRELAYIKAVQNGEKKIAVISRTDRVPYSFVENGKLVGIIPDYFSRLMETAGLPYTTLLAMNGEEYIKWISEKKADVILDCRQDAPTYIDGMATKPYMELTISRVTKKGFSGTPKVIAKITSQAVNDFTQESGEAQCLPVHSASEAIEAIKDGKADACYVYTYTAEKYINSEDDSNLSYTILKKPVYKAFICVNPNTDHELCSILNKCIMTDATSILSEYVTKYTTSPYKNPGLVQYLKQHPQFVMLISCAFVLLIALVAVLIVKSRTAKMQAEQLEKELKTAAELNASRIVIESLTEDFGCVNYVELTQNKFNDIGVNYRTSEILKKLIPGWENENNFTRKLELLRENFIYEPDREQFLQDTKREVVMNNLQDADTYNINARGFLNGEIRYYQMKFNAVRKDGKLIGVVAGLHSVNETVKKEIATNERLKDALRVANEEKLRNEIIHKIIHSGKWSFLVNANDEVTSADYSEDVQRVINNDLSHDVHAWTDILHPDDKEAAVAAFNAAIADHSGNTPYDVTYRMIDRNGAYHWFHSAGRIIRDANGNGEFFGVHIDITDQIEEQQHRLLGAVPLSPDILSKANIGLWAFELDEGKPPRMYVDDTMLGLIGLDHQVSPEETYHAWYDHIDKDSYSIVKDAVANMSAGEHAEVQYPWHNPNGHTLIVRCGGVLNPGYKKGIRIEGTHQNVTEVLHFDEEEVERLKQTEVQLRHEKLRSEVLNYMIDNDDDDPIELLKKFAERIRVLIECDQVIYRDLEETRIMVNSPAIEKTWSVPIEYCRQCQHFDAHHPMYAEGYTEMDNCQEGWKGIPVYHDCPIKSSLTRIVYCDGEVAGYLAIHFVQNYHHFTDLERATLEEFTRILSMSLSRYAAKKENKELKLVQEMQKQLQEALAMAQSANRAKTTFLNSMSHDIRTPMNAIIGFTGLAASHIDNKAQVQDYLAKISQSSSHLLSLINDVLDMSRIESGKMNLDEKPEHLPSIIHTLHDIVLADIHNKQHDFFIDTVNVNDENIICDKLRLNQVLLNILSNAIKYTAQGGTISMRITEKTIKPSGYATYEFVVKDNGMGMDKEYLKTIFDPFTRVKSSTVSGIQGTGLGMAITKNIIDMMGGKIDVQSELGKGTQMTVTFDFKLQEAHRESMSIPELKGLRGLVADDDANTCISIYGMLKEIGMRAEWCTSGKEAIFRAEAATRESDFFKVYIIDWLMPDMNGIETTRRIRKVIGDDAPIIILTAYDWSDIEDEAREAGVTAFVSKPMFPSDLHRVLNTCLGKTETEVEQNTDGLDFTGKKVLLVEDNPLNREIATELLTEYGFVIDTAEDGTIAVEKMKSAKDGDYDVILMDIQMPIMNGYDATKAIRALGTPVSKIPILAMTADAFEEDRKKAMDAGMNAHITKPIDIKVVRQTLAQFL